MDFDLPPDDDPRRIAVRSWLAAHPDPSATDLAAAGYVAPHWPAPFGLGAEPMHQLIIDDELRRAEVTLVDNPIGIGWAGPTIMAGGTEAQIDRYLPPMLSGAEFWCQLFSEPDAGSDLAALATRAVRDGDEYVVNGSKVWTTGAHYADLGILIARTDPDVSKHKGVSYFICDMSSPGITISPLIDMTGAHSFNEVFFDDVRIPAENLVGAEGQGWRLAKVTLANERVQLSAAGSLWGEGPSAATLLAMVVANGGETRPALRQRLAQLHCDAEVLRLNRLRTLSAQLAGRTPGPEASIQKVMSDEHGQQVMELAKDLVGTSGLLAGTGPSGFVPRPERTGTTDLDFAALDCTASTNVAGGVEPVWHYGYLFSPSLTLGGGTFAVQRNIVAEQVLGLPREPDAEAGMTWAETRKRRPA